MMDFLRLMFLMALNLLLISCQDDLFNSKGFIEVQSTPEGAEIYLDGKYTGETTNCVLEDIEPGKYSIKLTLSGYWDWESSVTVEAGDTAFIHAIFAIEEGTLKWKFEIAHPEMFIDIYPALASDGTIYYGGKHLYAIDPYRAYKWICGWNNQGFFSPAVASDGTIYVKVANFDEFGFSIYIYAFAPSGELKWEFDAGSYYLDADISPVIGSDGTIYFASDDSLFFALNPQGGKKWEYKIDEGSLFSSAAIGADGTIYFTVQNGYSTKFCLYALTPQGTLRWKREGIYGSPAIGSDGTIYLADRGNLYAFSPDGNEKWTYEDICHRLAIGSDGIIYAARFSYLSAISPEGKLLWQYRLNDEQHKLYYPTLGSDGIIYLGSGEGESGYLYAINPDGSFRWKFYLGDIIIGSPLIAEDGTIYCVTWGGTLYAITSSSRGLALSPWPKYAHDNQNTGRAGVP